MSIKVSAVEWADAITNAQANALRDAADFFEGDMAAVWGGRERWLTTGSHVAELVADILREIADEWATHATPGSEREAATSFLADAITFAMGAQVETDLGIGRWGTGMDWPERVATEWIESGMGDENLARMVAAAEEAARAEGYREGWNDSERMARP